MVAVSFMNIPKHKAEWLEQAVWKRIEDIINDRTSLSQCYRRPSATSECGGRPKGESPPIDEQLKTIEEKKSD